MKLDAGDPLMFAQINDGGASFTDVVDGLAQLPSVVVQAMFVTDAEQTVDNTTEGAVAAWLLALERVRATGVHIYTLQREPALGTLRPVRPRRLREIAERVRALQIPAQVF